MVFTGWLEFIFSGEFGMFGQELCIQSGFWAQVDQETPADSPQRIRGYPFPEIEAQWQQYWEENQTFRTPDVVDTTKPKYYVLDMFPYPRLAILNFHLSELKIIDFPGVHGLLLKRFDQCN